MVQPPLAARPRPLKPRRRATRPRRISNDSSRGAAAFTSNGQFQVMTSGSVDRAETFVSGTELVLREYVLQLSAARLSRYFVQVVGDILQASKAYGAKDRRVRRPAWLAVHPWECAHMEGPMLAVSAMRVAPRSVCGVISCGRFADAGRSVHAVLQLWHGLRDAAEDWGHP